MHNERTFQASSAAKLDSPERLAYLPPHLAAAQLNLAPGLTVADIGAGTGFFALPFARAVAPAGRVLAVDFQPEMLALLAAKLQAEPAPLPIDLVHGSATETTLAAASCDLALYAKIWHELDDPRAVLTEAARILRPAGRIAILDWRAGINGPPGPPAAHRVAQAAVEAALAASGWTLAQSIPFGDFSYLVVATVNAPRTAA